MLESNPVRRRAMNLIRMSRTSVRLPAHLRHQRVQLLMDVVPLPHPHKREKVLLACLPQFVLRQMLFLLVEELPEVEYDRKSESSSRNCACASSALSCLSIGRSRGSCTDSAEAMISTSLKAILLHRAARIIRPIRGSIGSRASVVPDRSVEFCVIDAPRVRAASAYPSRICRVVRRLEERETPRSPQPQRLHLQDHAGQVRPQDLRLGELRPGSKSSSEYSRMHTPALTRPQRPLRWSADWPARSPRSAAAAPSSARCSG